MFFRWLKNYMPRTLYGRAVLILLLPIVSLQVVVSVVFIQRHFNNITEQMTGLTGRELAYLVSAVNATETPEAARDMVSRLAPALLVEPVFPAPEAVRDRKTWDDFTGKRVMRSLYAVLPSLVGVDLGHPSGRVVLSIGTRHGLLQISLNRYRLSARNPHQLLVTMVLFGVLMSTISYLFLRNQLRPIKRLGRAAEAFGRGQVIPYRVSGAIEVRAAGQAFLDMRDRIERQIEARTLMLSGISHDLRTPLTRFKLGLSLIEESDQRAALERDVEEMERLVDAFLGFASSEAQDGSDNGGAELKDPAALLRLVAENATRAGQNVTLGRIDTAPEIPIRPLPVTRALGNLLANAARYADRARISLETGPDTVSFVVEDDGPGIAEDQLAEALKPFTRLDAARNQDRGAGVGLGLAIAADIARAHGGSLHLGRSAELGGLRAELRLPKA